MMENCVFCKIVAGEIPSSKVYEDEKAVVFRDIEPKAKIHLLCVPKQHFSSLSELNAARAALLGRMLETIGRHSGEWGLAEGYRLIVNQGAAAGQTVPHLHIHILGGQALPWE